MKSSTILNLGLAAWYLSAQGLSAAITYVGTEIGSAGTGFLVQNWSNAAVAKNYDIDGDNKYGSAGYYQIRPMPWDPGAASIGESVSAGNDLGVSAGSNPTLHLAPVFLSSITGAAGTYVNYGGYPIFRGPDGSALYREGSLSVSVSNGLHNTPSGSNNAYFGETFSFTVGTATNFRIGITADTAGNGAYAPNYVSIYSNSTGTVFSSLLTRDAIPDMAIFDIAANTGESFTAAVWQLSGTQSVAPFGMITFDAIPEPSSGLLSLLGLSSIGIWHRRRRSI
jgi:hypothetical protein